MATDTIPAFIAFPANTTRKTTHVSQTHATKTPATCQSTTTIDNACHKIATTQSTDTTNGFPTASGIEFGIQTTILDGIRTPLWPPVSLEVGYPNSKGNVDPAVKTCHETSP